MRSTVVPSLETRQDPVEYVVREANLNADRAFGPGAVQAGATPTRLAGRLAPDSSPAPAQLSTDPGRPG